MRHAFLGEVIAAAFNVTPRGWAPCDGTLLIMCSCYGLTLRF
jgi:microcystin-dependent protein